MLVKGEMISNFGGTIELSLCVYCDFGALVAQPAVLAVAQQGRFVLLEPSPCLCCVGFVNGKEREEDLERTWNDVNVNSRIDDLPRIMQAFLC